MSAWELPTCLCVGGKEWDIRTDFRAILDILKYFSDPDYEPDEQWEICLDILYKDYADMPGKLKQEAAEQAVSFIDMGIKDDGKRSPGMMDWEQDAGILVPAVNKAAGCEVRALPYLHWWTFLGYYMEIGESLFSHVLNIRQKKRKRKKLEKWEAEFYRENKKLIDLKKQERKRPEHEQEALRALFGTKK